MTAAKATATNTPMIALLMTISHCALVMSGLNTLVIVQNTPLAGYCFPLYVEVRSVSSDERLGLGGGSESKSKWKGTEASSLLVLDEVMDGA